MATSNLRTLRTPIPGQAPIELIVYYPQFEVYFADCEMQTKKWCVEHVRPDWTILDIGANVGYYSILFSRLAAQGIVHAFEPTQTADMLEKNLAHNKCTNVHVQRMAIGRTTETKEDKIFRIWGEKAEKAVYPFITLDAYVAQQNLERVDCIKIDVDSYELDVLLGAQKTLERFNPVIICEFNNFALLQRQTDSMALTEWFMARGYYHGIVLDKENIVMRREPTLEHNAPTSFEFIYPAQRDAVNDRDNGFYDIKDEIKLEILEQLASSPTSASGEATPWIDSLPEPQTAALAVKFKPITANDQKWIVEIVLEVAKGELSIGIIDDKNTFISARRRVEACPASQTFHLMIEQAQVAQNNIYQLAVLNINRTWQSSRFRLLSLRAYNL